LMYESENKKKLMSQAFSWFYMAINIGAASTSFSLPIIRDHYGYAAAFIAPTVLMVVSLGIFYLGKKHYPRENIKGVRKSHITPEQKKIDSRIVWRIMGLFSLIIFFWSIFDQSYSTWTLFARDYMILETPLGFRLPPDSIQSLNPFLIVGMTPIFAWIWSKTDKSETVRLSSPKKMLIGFSLVALCMVVMSLAGFLSGKKVYSVLMPVYPMFYETTLITVNKISVLWELLAYILITAGELCISVVGLQLAFEEAPDHMKSRITGMWLATVTLGDILASFFVRIYTDLLNPGEYFGLMAIMMVLVTIGFYFVGRKFEEKSNRQKEDTSPPGTD
jgi:POT family proton-dependent oligopeptide transporter